MKLQDIFESPQYTFPTNFNFDNTEHNIKFTKNFLSDPRKKEIDKIGKFRLYAFPNKYALISHDNESAPIMAYCMQYEVLHNNFINRTCVQQVVIWVDFHFQETEGLAKRIFFNHLLPTYNTISTDAVQTPDGERFWGRRIVDSFSLGYNVYYVDMMKTRDEGIMKIDSISEYRELSKNTDIWGHSNAHKYRRIILSKNNLT